MQLCAIASTCANCEQNLQGHFAEAQGHKVHCWEVLACVCVYVTGDHLRSPSLLCSASAACFKHDVLLQMYYLNPVTWTLYGLVASNVGDLDNAFITLNDGGPSRSVSVPEFLRETFDYRHDWLGYVVLILIGWIILFWGLGAYAFKKFNFQKR